MALGRAGASATLLASGVVLVAGGLNNNGDHVVSGELYDPGTNTWSPSAPMAHPRSVHTATRLNSGKVLVAGGWGAYAVMRAEAELYDPDTNAWSPAGSLLTLRRAHTATLLQSGKVLIVGGRDSAGRLASAELYDPATNAWEYAGSLGEARQDHTATLLNSGRVLITGGNTFTGRISSTEIYDPVTNQWTPSGALFTARDNHTATLLGSGKVLVVGGYDFPQVIGTAEIYDESNGTWGSAGSLITGRLAHTAHMLPSGRVLIASGRSVAGPLARAELYAPETSTSLTASPASTVVGETYLVSVVVSGVSGVPAGTVMVNDDAGASCGPVALSSGAAACTLASGTAGIRTLTATFSPTDGAFASSSATASQSVAAADTILSIDGHQPDPSIPTEAITVAVELAVVAPAAGIPSGAIAISDGVDGCSIPEGATSCGLILATRGPRTLTATYTGDGHFNGSSSEVVHNVNRLPVPSERNYGGLEGAPIAVAAAQGVLAGATDPDDDNLTIANTGTIAASGIGGMVLLHADGSFDYTPPADANGAASFEYVVSDGLEEVAATATITVEALNDPPTFVLAGVPAWPAGESGAKLQPGFASVSAFGPPDEAGQQVQAWSVRTIADPSGVASNVAISNDGTLSYTLSGNAGSATFGVTLQDDGGTANGGDDTSDEQAFTITVAAGLDLSIAIDDDRDFAQGGDTVEYAIVVHNAGPNAAVGARVRNLLPFNLVDASWACTPDAGASCTAEGTGDIDDSVTIPMGSTLTYLLGATVLAEPELPIENSVSVIAPDGVPDADGTNNSATDVDTVGIFADGFGGDDATLH